MYALFFSEKGKKEHASVFITKLLYHSNQTLPKCRGGENSVSISDCRAFNPVSPFETVPVSLATEFLSVENIAILQYEKFVNYKTQTILKSLSISKQ